MAQRFDPRLDILPDAQKEIWAKLSAAPRLSFVLYGGTAVALHLGHRQSVDFDFFRADPLDKAELREAFAFFDDATVFQDSPDTLAVLAPMPSGPVKISFFGGIGFGRVSEPLQTTLARTDQELLRNARDRVSEVPDVPITPGSLAVPLGRRNPS